MTEHKGCKKRGWGVGVSCKRNAANLKKRLHFIAHQPRLEQLDVAIRVQRVPKQLLQNLQADVVVTGLDATKERPFLIE